MATLKKTKKWFQDQLWINAGQEEHSAKLSTFIKLPFAIVIFVLSIFEWLFKRGLTVPFLSIAIELYFFIGLGSSKDINGKEC